MALILVWMRLPRPWANRALAGLVLIASLNYARFSVELPFQRVDNYDLVHYWLNAKYFPELGYYDLYPACIEADHENGGPKFPDPVKYMAQDETGDHLEPIEQAYARGPVVKARFTPERWKAFTHDFLYLQRDVKGMEHGMWEQMVQDHGYNGTTVWTLEALPIVYALPVEQIKLVCFLDVLLLLAAIGAVRWAWNESAAGFVALFLMVSYSTRWPAISWSLLRYDYVTALVIATCLLRKGRPFLAGMLTGWSATLRLFPAVWMILPGLKGGFGLLKREVQRPLLMLLGGFLVAVAVLQGAATLALGTDAVKTHFENMQQHTASDELSSRRIGLALALRFRGDLEPENLTKAMKAEVEDQRHVRYGIAAVLMLALGFVLRERDDDEVFAFGFLPFFLLTTASYYYYVTRATLITAHAGRLEDTRSRVGLAMLFGIEAWTNATEVNHPDHRVYLIGTLAWWLCLYALVHIGWLFWERRRA